MHSLKNSVCCGDCCYYYAFEFVFIVDRRRRNMETIHIFRKNCINKSRVEQGLEPNRSPNFELWLFWGERGNQRKTAKNGKIENAENSSF